MKHSLLKYTIVLIAIFISALTSNAQTNILKGRIFDGDNKAVKGAEVSLVNSPDKSVKTDEYGYFALQAAPGDKIKVKAGKYTKVFILQKAESVYTMDDFFNEVKLGYHYKKQKDLLTASVSTVHSKELGKFNVFNSANALYGELTGLIVTQSAGVPWARTPTMRVRGKGTLNDAKYITIVDGFERPFSTLSLDEIESISVLKDAASLAAYGMRGANGVIVVNTKRGEYNTFNVDVKYQDGFNTPFREAKMLDAYDYALAMNEASRLDGNSDIYSKWDLQDYKDGSKPLFYPNVNWLSEVLKDRGRKTNLTAQFYGGGNKIKYYTLINYQTEKGIFNYTDVDSRYDSQLKYRRLNVRTNIDAKITKSTLLSANIGADIGERKYPGEDIQTILNAIYDIPSAAFPVKSLNGYWGGTDFYGNNPAAMIGGTGYRNDFLRNFKGDLTIKQDLDIFLKGLSFEVAASVDNNITFREGLLKDYEYEVVNVVRDQTTGEITDTITKLYGMESDLEYYNGGIDQWRQASFMGHINYDNKWGDHSLNSDFMYFQYKEVYREQYNTWLAQNYVINENYNYKDKYLACLVMSFSGSNVLPENHRFNLFPALSAAWLISSEDFMKDSRMFNFLKLRVSWGIAGNDKMEQNLYDQKFNPGSSYLYTDNFTSVSGIVTNKLGVTNLTSEKSYKTNIGIDLYMFNKLSMTIDAFYDRRKDILVETNPVVSNVIGIAPPLQNMGIVDNRGIEFDFMWKDEIGKISYYIGGSFLYNKNKVIEKNEAYKPYDYLRSTGLPLGQNFGYEVLGYFKDSTDIANSPEQLFSDVRPGDIKYKDQNGDGKVDQDDQVPMEYTGTPEIYYSLKLGFEYLRFGVDLLFQGIGHRTSYLSTTSIFWPLRNNTNISDFTYGRTWTPDNPDADLPRLTLLQNNNNYRTNNVWLESSDYFKLRSLMVYYTFPEKWITWAKLDKAKVFVKGNNLFSIDKISYVDPENLGKGYPTMTSWDFGLSIHF